MFQFTVYRSSHLRVGYGLYGSAYLLAVGEQPIVVEHRQVLSIHTAEGIRQAVDIEQFVLDNIDRLLERFDRREEPLISRRIASRESNAVSWLSSSTS
jgi:hypothetical protein